MTEEKTILLVDDDAIICSDHTRILRQEGYAVVTAMNGQTAIDRMNGPDSIDLILMDIDLGKGMDGAQAAEIIQREHRVPLVFLSGHTELEIVKRTEKITSYGFIVKGSGPNVLTTAIRMAFRLHSAHVENIRYADTLKDSELRYRRLFESAQDGILILNANKGNIIDVNPYLADLIGYPYGEIVGKYLWEISPFRDITENQGKFLELQKQGYVHYEHLPLMSKGGIVKHVEFISNVYQVRDEKIIQCNIRDIEKRKKNENIREAVLKGKVVMLRELQHRIKNSMAVIAGLINLEHDRTPNPEVKAAFDRIRDRLSSISNLYAILNSFDNADQAQLDSYIETMLNELFKNYSDPHRKITLELELDKITIDADKALPIGLIVNELVTNSLKYAFTDNRDGCIRVSLKHDNDEGVIEVSDDGIGIPAGPMADNSKRLGISLVEMLAEQIGGKFKRVVIVQGTLSRVQFPLNAEID